MGSRQNGFTHDCSPVHDGARDDLCHETLKLNGLLTGTFGARDNVITGPSTEEESTLTIHSKELKDLPTTQASEDAHREENVDGEACDKKSLPTFHPVDEGYSWVIMMAAFGIQFLLIGYLKSLGIFFVEFQARFGSSSSETSLIIGVMEMTGGVTAPLVMAILVKRTSPRTCCLIGSVLLVVGVAGNAWFDRIELLCLTQGVCFGLAIALQFGAPFLALTQYFNKRRALATSISTCGASLGGVIFPLLCRSLLDEYAFEGGILMTAGVQMHAFVFSMLLTPVDAYKKRGQSDASSMPETVTFLNHRSEVQVSGSKFDFTEIAVSEKAEGLDISENCSDSDSVFMDVMTISKTDREINESSTLTSNDGAATGENSSMHENQSFESAPVSRHPDKSKAESKRLVKCSGDSAKKCMIRCRENNLTRSLTFWLLCGFFLCASIGSAVPQTYLPAFADERGLSKDEGAFLVSVLNVLDIPAHLLPGVIINFRLLGPSRLSVVPLLIVGIMGNLTPFLYTYNSLLGMTVVYGMFLGTYFVMQPLIVLELLGADNFPSAIGIYYGLTGVGASISYPICGALRDMGGTYTYSFQYLGLAAVMAAILLVLAPLARRYDIKRQVLRAPGRFEVVN